MNVLRYSDQRYANTPETHHSRADGNSMVRVILIGIIGQEIFSTNYLLIKVFAFSILSKLNEGC